MSDLFEGMEGQGFENMKGDAFSIPMLLIAQPTSKAMLAEDSNIKLGDFYNSITNESFGKELEIIPCYYKQVWLEWKPNMGGLVGRHLPGSIPVVGDTYTGMKTQEGNIIEENWIYYVMIVGKEEQGVFQFSLKSSGLKYAKKWNSLISLTKLANGKQAPFFSSSWTIKSYKNENDQGVWYTIGSKSESEIKRVDFINREQLALVQDIILIAPTLLIADERDTPTHLIPAERDELSQLAIEAPTNTEGKY